MNATTQQAPAADCDAILDGFEDLPTIPEVLVRIWRIVDDPDSSATDLERAVSLEPPLAARVLRLANSPYFGGRGGIADVHAAIRQLGFATVRNLAVCLSVAGGLAGAQSTDPGVDRRRLWRHCVATGVVAKRLSRVSGIGSPDELFTAGLLHDLGKFVIAMGAPTGYRDVARTAQAEEMTLPDAERQVIGADHATLGAAFAERWGFPEALRSAILNHHAESGDPEARLIGVSDVVAHILAGERVFDFEPPVEETDPSLAELGIDEDWDALRSQIQGDIDGAQEFMNLV